MASTQIQETDIDDSQWLSTYGMITAKRIIDYYKMLLDDRDLLRALKQPQTFIHEIARLPLQNVLNDVIRQQAHDYMTYGQKIFVDYLLSGETSRPEGAQGDHTRQELEQNREQMLELINAYQTDEYIHFRLISETQRHLIKRVSKWQKKALKNIESQISDNQLSLRSQTMVKLLNGVLCHVNLAAERNSIDEMLDKLLVRDEPIDLDTSTQTAFVDLIHAQMEEAKSIVDSLEKFKDRSTEMYQKMRQYREDFSNMIIKTNELIKLLPDYKANPERDQKNKEDLHFNSHLGDPEENKE